MMHISNMSNFAIYLENNFICIRIYENITKHRIFLYAPNTNYAETIYVEFEMLYNRISITQKDYTFTMIDDDNFLTNISYKRMFDKNTISFVSLDNEGEILCQAQNYRMNDDDLRGMKEFLDILKAYLQGVLEVSFFRRQ